MLTVLIRKDESTEVPRQVENMAAARALITDGMPVYVLAEDGSKTLVTAEESPVEAVVDTPPAAPEKAAPAKKAAAKKKA